MRSACFFWPGSEAEIEGLRPTYYLHFDDHFPDEKRIDQVIAWLKLPAAGRPHLITLYYSNVDHAGHQYGPDSPATGAAVAHLDQLVGDLWGKLTALQLPIDLVVVSDHGMEREQGDWIDLSKYADLQTFTTVGSLLYPNSEADAAKAYQQLRIKSDAFTVYRRQRVPAALHYDSNAREGGPPDAGAHGYDPRGMPSMRAFFLAVGPDIRPGSKLEPFENVNVYPFIAKILGLDAPKVDGSLNVLSKILKNNPADDTP
jgi:alkaline phosphatase D